MRPAGPPPESYFDRVCISHDPLCREAAAAVWRRWHFDRFVVGIFRYWIQSVIRDTNPKARIETAVAVMQRAYAELSGEFPG